MIFQEMIQRHLWDDVWRSLFKRYPDQLCNLKGYRAVYNRLKNLQPEVTDSRLMIIDASDEPGVIDPDVFMLEKKEGAEEYTDYSLSMLPWATVMGLSIDEHSDPKVPELLAISYALFKMTYFGFTEPGRDSEFNKLIKEHRKGNKKMKKLKLNINKKSMLFNRWLVDFNNK